MREIREVLRLKFDAGLSVRKIAKSLSIGHSSAGDYLCRFAASGLQWLIDLSDAELNRRLFPPAVPAPSDQRPTPDWAHVHAELRRPASPWPCSGKSTDSPRRATKLTTTGTSD